MSFYLDKKLAYAEVLCYNVKAVGLRRQRLFTFELRRGERDERRNPS